MARQQGWFALVLALAISAAALLFTTPLQLGLDLRGGSQITVEVQPAGEIKRVGAEQMEAVKVVLDRRVNGLGVAESTLQTVGENQLVLQLPGEQDPTAAEGAVIFDGVDPRGADRPIGCVREPGVVATDSMFEALFIHEEKIGEGDIKLAYVANRVREIVAGQACFPMKEARLHMTCTIDTVSFHPAYFLVRLLVLTRVCT